VGKDGLRLLLNQNGTQLTAIGWGMAWRAPEIPVGSTIDVAFKLDRDDWNGDLQLRLADFRP
jgi:hypothetical protein